jgi:hypothetical protein
MSNPQEKAEELIIKMYYSGRFDDKENYSPVMAYERAKQCALIAVDEMLDYRNALFINEGSLAHQYLLQVKEEINKL